MPGENAAKIVFMPPPFTADDPARYDAEIILAAVKGQDKLAVLGGGGTLNAMIQESARTGDAGPEIRRKFKERAEELLRLGAAGFGELTAEHFQGATPYQSAPPDHPLFLLLADIAAEHGVPIDLHMEALPQTFRLPAPMKSPPNPPQLRANIAAFERLLDAQSARAHHLGPRRLGQHRLSHSGSLPPAARARIPTSTWTSKIDPAEARQKFAARQRRQRRDQAGMAQALPGFP